MVRAQDSRLKDCGFKTMQERQENFPLQSTFCADSDCPTPVLPQQHIKDPRHSTKSESGRLQLNMHAPYVCGFAWSDMVHGVHRTHWDGSSFMWHQPCQCCKYTTSVDIQKGTIKKASHSCRITCERSETVQERRIALYKSDQQEDSFVCK